MHLKVLLMCLTETYVGLNGIRRSVFCSIQFNAETRLWPKGKFNFLGKSMENSGRRELSQFPRQ